VAWTSQVSLKKANPSQHLVSKPVASLSCTAALGTTCQAEQQTMQNKSAVVNKAPIESKDKAFTPKLDDGGTGEGPGSGGDGGGGGGMGFYFGSIANAHRFLKRQ
jgi:hypothetical protein